MVADGVDPLLRLQKEMCGLRLYRVRGLPGLTGGAVGYLSYECVQYFESTVPVVEHDELQLPESIFMLCDSLVVFDHVKHTLLIISHCR